MPNNNAAIYLFFTASEELIPQTEKPGSALFVIEIFFPVMIRKAFLLKRQNTKKLQSLNKDPNQKE